ncbi:MAG: T9SS type A sorting domain-containing protein, partial [Bacteroidetes bacterium]|nr:T9SS type A sorting domain-containing protein [Bacteroidota bacterium]
LTGPASCPELLWHRAVSSGPEKRFVHVIGLTAPVANSGTLYNGQDGALLYSRSSDGGTSWDIQNVQLPETDTNYSYGYSGDSYHFAEPVGETLAFLYGSDWDGVFLEKSTDNGVTWNKKVIFQTPYPKFKETTTLVTDSFWTDDGYVNCVLDNTGKAHVFFGIQRVCNTIINDAQTQYYPYTDGLAYWNEDMPPFTTLNVDTLDAHHQLVGWTQDINGNDTIFEFLDPMGNYQSSVTTMPYACIDGSKIFLFFTSVMENLNNSVQNYRHIYYRRSDDLGQSWTDFVDVTGSITNNFKECVFPSVSPTSNEFVHILFQKDDEPGLAVRGDADPYGDNTMSYMKIPKSNVGIDDITSNITYVTQNYPNPFTTSTQVTVNLKRAVSLSLTVTNFIGQTVVEIPAASAAAGYHTFTLDGSNFRAGIYFYTVKAGSQTITRKMIVQ